jgi:dihydropyrimidine dehydrogenase (NAD+) subunit PreT
VDDGLSDQHRGVYAIGDCIRASGAASTVMAVQDGKLAARQSINSLHNASDGRGE